MAKREERWPIWKIVLVMVALIACAVGLFVASYYVVPRALPAEEGPTPGSESAAGSTMSNVLRLFGAICCGAALVCVGWLVVRYQQSIPAWKKRAKLPVHRRK